MAATVLDSGTVRISDVGPWDLRDRQRVLAGSEYSSAYLYRALEPFREKRRDQCHVAGLAVHRSLRILWESSDSSESAKAVEVGCDRAPSLAPLISCWMTLSSPEWTHCFGPCHGKRRAQRLGCAWNGKQTHEANFLAEALAQ